jgi:hypothetical protein
MEDIIMKYLISVMLTLFSLNVSAGQALDAGAITKLFTDKTVTAYSEIKKAPVSLFYDDNGEVRGIFTNGKKGKTKWWVKDSGLICLKSKKGDLCFKVVQKGDSYQKFLVKANGDSILAFSMETFTSGNSNQY